MSDKDLRELSRRVLVDGETSLRVRLQRELWRAGRPVEEAWSGSGVTSGGYGRDKAHIQALLASVDVDRLRRFFPVGARGALPLKTAVLLQPLVPGGTKGNWLAGLGPEKRSDEQVIRLRVADLDGANQRHRWDAAPWLWRADEEPTPARLFGVPGAAAPEVPAPEQTEALAAACAAGTASAAERAGLSVRYQLDARPVDALSLYGVHVEPDLLYLLSGGARGQVDDYYASHSPPEEAFSAAIELGRLCAPWRLEPLLRAEAAKEPRRRKPAPPLQLLGLPSGHRHSRKPRVSLRAESRDGSGPTLGIEHTASNRRLPDCLWRRPLLRGETPPTSKAVGEWPFDSYRE